MIRTILNIATPFLLAAVGGLFTELAGILNIALEGLMLVGAFSAVIGTYYTGSLFFGILFGALCGMIFSLIFSWAGLKLRANIFIAGLAINLLAVGITAFVSTGLFKTKGVIALTSTTGLSALKIPFIHDIPVLGEILSGHTSLTYFCWLLLIASAFMLKRTTFGLAIRATGEDADLVKANGKNPHLFQFIAVTISGFACGIAGASLSLNLAAYVPNISAGRGWIALVAVYLGNRRPLGIALACMIFALAEYLANFMQGRIAIPRTVTLALPYLITLVSMILFALLGKRKVTKA